MAALGNYQMLEGNGHAKPCSQSKLELLLEWNICSERLSFELKLENTGMGYICKVLGVRRR